jgi:hypothetical protein
MKFRPYHIILSSLILLMISCGTPGQNQLGSDFTPSFTTEEIQRYGKSDDVSISAISNILVTSDGLSLVTDGRAPAIYIFDQNGSLVGNVGEVGFEAGQFDVPPVISLFENDSLFTFDRSLARASIFHREGDLWLYSRDFQVSTQLEDGYTINAMVKLEGLDGYVTTEQMAMDPTNPETLTASIRYRIIDELGQAKQANYIQRKPQELVSDNSSGNPMIKILPFGRNSFLRVEKGGEYYLGAWNDKLSIQHFNVNNEQMGSIDLSVAERTITDDDKRLDPRSADPAIANLMPTTHPAYVSFLVSDKGNYWINLGQINAESTFWVVVDPASTVLGSTLLPATTRPVRIINGKMYAANQGSSTEPEVVVLKVDF